MMENVAKSGRERLFLQDPRGDEPDAEKPNHLDKHVGGGVDRRKPVPIPIGNIRRDGCEDAGHGDKCNTRTEGR